MPTAPGTGERRRLPARRVKASGPWGVWLDARLLAKVMTQKEAYDQLRTRWPDLFPWSENSIDSFRAYIRGKAPDAQQQAAFIELFGGPGPNTAGSGGDTPDPAALSALSKALTAQAEAFAQMLAFAIRRDQSVESRIRAMEAEVQSLRERLAVATSPEQSTPRQTGE